MVVKIDAVAQSGFSDASSYETHRPSYPPEAVSALLKNLNIDSELHGKIVDLAAGTGKFTELLAAREEEYEIIAVEPHDGMRNVLSSKQLKGVKVVKGMADNMEAVEGGWADAVIVAQAFHWFATEDTLKEIHRVLKPAGILGLIWNVEDYNSRTDWKPSTEWEGKFKDITWSLDDNKPRFRHDAWKKVFENNLSGMPAATLAADPVFSLPIGQDPLKWTVWLTKDAIWDRFHTISHIANLEVDKLEETRKKVYEALEGPDVETNKKGEVALHGQTVWAWTTAIPGAPLRDGG